MKLRKIKIYKVSKTENLNFQFKLYLSLEEFRLQQNWNPFFFLKFKIPVFKIYKSVYIKRNYYIW